MTDDYDEPVSCDALPVLCPTCGGELKPDDTMAEDGYKFWCDGCEGWVKEADTR